MDDLYVEKFFHNRESSEDTGALQTAPSPIESPLTISNTLDRMSQMLLFFRLLKEDCDKHLEKIPYLSTSLLQLEEAIDSMNYPEALILMDNIEELLDIIYS